MNETDDELTKVVLMNNEEIAKMHVNNIDLSASVHTNNLEGVIRSLENGANVRMHCEHPMQLSVSYGYRKITAKLLEYGADIHYNDDCMLRRSVNMRNLKMVAMLLEYGANVHCNNQIILKGLSDHFDEPIADIILPYCGSDVYHYFPNWYIVKNIVPTKSAAIESVTIESVAIESVAIEKDAYSTAQKD